MEKMNWIKQNFNRTSEFNFSCPNCYNTSLKLVKDKLLDFETIESQKMREDFFEVDWIRSNVSGVLKCGNCGENVVFTAEGAVELIEYYDHETDEYHENYDSIFKPTFFQPTLNIFKIAENCPILVRNEIMDSFKLYWSDLASCANKIRTSLELLLNEQKVNKTKIVNHIRIRISIHNRITLFKDKNPKVAEYLLAIKWIGNSGSHVGKLERIDILETYELLEYSINNLYDNSEIELEKIKKEIIKRKGKRKRQK